MCVQVYGYEWLFGLRFVVTNVCMFSFVVMNVFVYTYKNIHRSVCLCSCECFHVCMFKYLYM